MNRVQQTESRRQTLLAAAKQAYRDREISRRDLRKVRFRTLFPGVMEKIEKEVMAHAADLELPCCSDETAAEWAGTDWITILTELLPVILELLAKLFNR